MSYPSHVTLASLFLGIQHWNGVLLKWPCTRWPCRWLELWSSTRRIPNGPTSGCKVLGSTTRFVHWRALTAKAYRFFTFRTTLKMLRFCRFRWSMGHATTSTKYTQHVWLHVLTKFDIVVRAPLLRMYPRWLNILILFFLKASPQIWHCILPSPKSTYQGVQSLVRVLVIVLWATTTLK
jgi:hypothetical protein